LSLLKLLKLKSTGFISIVSHARATREIPSTLNTARARVIIINCDLFTRTVLSDNLAAVGNVGRLASREIWKYKLSECVSSSRNVIARGNACKFPG